ncbi:hypothetical protein DFJ58DRAFT_502094 [Suillus subalutaceus]|uniref:uncharacterized protein n=1 Tax=Suillus subalutaceus TaxID=48586 RepID=UPI001B872E3A|nr:uncharacterized protein DFJ58DRAFT_502094 [Suillus subalutaceus]KAG1846102.1 hypothetical protein DFJ58DRAFT_502094 [Suillus subalutaceus]
MKAQEKNWTVVCNDLILTLGWNISISIRTAHILCLPLACIFCFDVVVFLYYPFLSAPLFNLYGESRMIASGITWLTFCCRIPLRLMYIVDTINACV